jgi:hypothetical protein
MHVGSKIIVPPFAARTSSTGTLSMKLNEAAAYNDASRMYTSFPYMSVGSGQGDAASTAYKFAPIECTGFNSAVITPFATNGGGNMSYAAYLIHSNNQDGGTPTMWHATLLQVVSLTSTPFPTTLATGNIPDELNNAVVTSGLYHSTKAGSNTSSPGAIASITMYDNIFGTASSLIGSTSIPHQSNVSFLGGASHLAITFTQANAVSGARIGFIVTLSE